MTPTLAQRVSSRGHLAFTVTALAAYVPLVWSIDWTHDFWRGAVLVGLGLLYILIGTVGFELMPHTGGQGSPLVGSIYFAIQLALVSLILFLSRGINLTVLIILPLAAHSVILFSRTGIIVVCSIMLLMMLILFISFTDVLTGIQATLSIGAGIVFVVAFSQLTQSEVQARREVERLAAQLTQANQQLREYAVQAEGRGGPRERNRLARKIPDGVGHYLRVINVQIQAARAVQGTDPARAAEAMGKAGAMTQEALADIRRSVAALRAAPTENKPITESLNALVEEAKASGLQATLTLAGAVRALSPQADLTLYRAAQEALTNVQKHAHASAVQVKLDYTDLKRVTLTVQDNGIGVNAASANGQEGGFGLLGVRERAQLLNGQVRIVSPNGSGFLLEIELPTAE